MYTIIPISAFSDNYIWLIQTANKQCLIVDPGDATPVLNFLTEQQLSLAAILVTHHHHDHCGGVTTLLEHYNVPVYTPASESVAGSTHKVKENDTVTLETLDLTFNILDIPAHTAGHIAFYNDDWLFSGDTLFSAGCGRLFEGSATQMFNSLHKLARLKDSTQVYCGHEYTQKNLEFALTLEPNHTPTQKRYEQVLALREQNQASLPSTIAIEKATNPFLRCHEVSIKNAAEAKFGKKLSNEIAVFAAIRTWKDQF